MITRRTFIGAIAVGSAISLTPRLMYAAEVLRARNVVLVHGLFADGFAGQRSSRAYRQRD